MTDKEIIQAQRICFRDLDDGAACPNCPLYGNENCLAEVMGGAADLLEWLSGASADLRKEIEWKDKVIALAQRKQAEAEAERDALREKQRWIPVTERLPDERDAVIILLKDGQVFRGEIRKRIALPEWWYFYDASDTDMDMLGVMYPLFDDGLWLHENPVVAWMPLPEAPEEGEKA